MCQRALSIAREGPFPFVLRPCYPFRLSVGTLFSTRKYVNSYFLIAGDIRQAIDRGAQRASVNMAVGPAHGSGFMSDDLPGHHVTHSRSLEQRRRCVTQAMKAQAVRCPGRIAAFAAALVVARRNNARSGHQPVELIAKRAGRDVPLAASKRTREERRTWVIGRGNLDEMPVEEARQSG